LNVPLADYETNLRNFISSARNKGMTPVLLTSVYMYSEVYLNGNVNNNSSSISPYRQKCIDLGAELNVPVLDVGAAHKALALSWGVDNAKKLFNWNTTANTFDGVHMSGIGADEIAKIVVKKIKENSSNAMISLEGLINNAVSIDAVLSSIVYPW
jgi:lysophospholipase L1-like esterase